VLVKNIVKKDVYYDSVTLMLVSKNITKEEGVLDASIMMGTEENIKILKSAGLLEPDTSAGPNDMIIAIKGDDKKVESIIDDIDIYFEKSVNKEKESMPESIEGAIEIMKDANLALVSVAGRYAGAVAEEALKHNLNVQIFSDNVPLEYEIKLKKMGIEKNLFVLGPDAGTSIINGEPIAFANVVNRGNIGIVGASGTGIQETSVIISKNGGGISQALGIGSRDLSKEVDGIMAKFSLDALQNDDMTDVILFVSKLPSMEVASEMLKYIDDNITKPIVTIFMGAKKEFFKGHKVYAAENLFEASMLAVYLSKNEDVGTLDRQIENKIEKLKKIGERNKKRGKYIRGLYSGGTLCEEAMSILMPKIGDIYSNVPLDARLKLQDVFKSKEHTFIDLGSDEFTVGRPHPMIDYEMRMRRMLDEVKDETVGVILMDIVLGYGSNPDPALEVVTALKKAKEYLKENGREAVFVGYILGTDKDIQNYRLQREALEKEGMIIVDSNYEAAKLAGLVISGK